MKIFGATVATISGMDFGKGLRVATRNSESGGDSSSFSTAALNLAGVDPTTKFSANTVTTKLGDKDVVYNQSTNTLSIGGTKVNMAYVGNLKTDDLTFQVVADKINVHRYKDDGSIISYQLNSSGKLDIYADADDLVDTASQLIFANSGKRLAGGGTAHTGGTGNDVIINRLATGAAIDGGAGNDKIFNFAKDVSSLKGSAGNDSIYTVGLTAGTIDTTDAGTTNSSYVKILNAMTGGEIKLGEGKSFIDATGQKLTDVNISDASANAIGTVLRANALQGTGTINLKALDVAVDVTTLTSNLTLGAGNNSLVADTVKGNTITSTGVDSFQFKNVTDSIVDQSGTAAANSSVIKITNAATRAEFKMGAGVNTLDATKKTLTDVKITDAAADASTAILAGAIKGTAADKSASTITLKGNTAADGNGLQVSGGITQTTVNLGVGVGEIKAGSVANSDIIMGAAGQTYNQKMEIVGNFSNSTLTTGDGKDEILIKGTLSGGTFDLGKGDNKLEAKKAVNNLTYNSTAEAGESDTLLFNAALKNSNITMGAGDNILKAENAKGVAQAITNTSITAGDGDTTIVAGKYTTGATGNAITLGDAANSVTFNSIATHKSDTSGLELTMGSGSSNAQTLTVKGAANRLTYVGSDAADTLSFWGKVTNGDFTLGDGVNGLTVQNAKGVAQAMTNTNITAGAGDTTIVAGKYTTGAGGNSITLGNGENSVTFNSIAANKADTTNGLKLDLSAGGTNTQTLTVNGAVNRLNYIGADDIDKLIIRGALSNSKIDVGDGDNDIEVAKASGAGQTISNTNITAATAGSATNTLKAGAFKAGADGNTISFADTESEITLSSITGTAANKAQVLQGTAEGAAVASTLTVSGAVTNAELKSSSGISTYTLNSLKNSEIELKLVGGDTTGGDKTINITNGVSGSTIYNDAGKLTLDIGGAVSDSTIKAVDSLIGSAVTYDSTVTIGKTANKLTYEGGKGVDDITVNGTISNSTFALDEGANKVTAVKNGVGQAVTSTSFALAAGAGSLELSLGSYKPKAGGYTLELGDDGKIHFIA